METDYEEPTSSAISLTLRCSEKISLPQGVVVQHHLDRQLGGGEILQSGTDRLEQRDLVIEAPPGALAAGQIVEVAGNVVRRQDARGQRLHDVAGLLAGALAGVDED